MKCVKKEPVVAVDPPKTEVQLLAATLKGPVVEEDYTYLAAADLDRYERARLAEELVQQRILLVRAQRLLAVAEYEKALADLESKHQARMQVLGITYSSAQQQLPGLTAARTQLLAAMSERYALDFNVVSYDDVTGRIVANG